MSNEKTREILVMEFVDIFSNVKSIRVSNPKSDLTAETVETAMELFKDLRVFNSISQHGMATLKGAKKVKTVTTDFGIVIS